MAIDPISEALSNTESGQVLQEALGSVGAQSPDQQREEQNVVPAQLEEGEDFQELIERVGGDVDATIERLASTQLRNFSTENVQRLVETGEINDILQQGLTATGGPEFEIVNPQADQVQSELEQQGGPSQPQQTQDTTTQDRPPPQPQGQQVQPTQTQGQTAGPIEDMGAGGTNLGRNISQQFTVDTFSLQDAVQDEQTQRRVNELEQQAQQTIQQVTQDDEEEADGSGFRSGLFDVLRTGIDLIGIAADPEAFMTARQLRNKQQQADRAGDAIQAQGRIVDVINEQGIQDPQQRVRTGAEMLANAGLDPQNHRQFLRTLSNNPEDADKVNQVQKARTLVQEFLVKSDNVSNETQFNALRDNLVGQIQQFDNLTEQQREEIVGSVEDVQFGELTEPEQEDEPFEPEVVSTAIDTLEGRLRRIEDPDAIRQQRDVIVSALQGREDLTDEEVEAAIAQVNNIAQGRIDEVAPTEDRRSPDEIIEWVRTNAPDDPQNRERFINRRIESIQNRDDLSSSEQDALVSDLETFIPSEEEIEEETQQEDESLQQASNTIGRFMTFSSPTPQQIDTALDLLDSQTPAGQEQIAENQGFQSADQLRSSLEDLRGGVIASVSDRDVSRSESRALDSIRNQTRNAILNNAPAVFSDLNMEEVSESRLQRRIENFEERTIPEATIGRYLESSNRPGDLLLRERAVDDIESIRIRHNIDLLSGGDTDGEGGLANLGRRGLEAIGVGQETQDFLLGEDNQRSGQALTDESIEPSQQLWDEGVEVLNVYDSVRDREEIDITHLSEYLVQINGRQGVDMNKFTTRSLAHQRLNDLMAQSDEFSRFNNTQRQRMAQHAVNNITRVNADNPFESARQLLIEARDQVLSDQ